MTLARLDLRTVDWDSPPTLDGPTVGVSTAVLPARAAPLLERLVYTVAPGGPGITWVDADLPQLAPPARPTRVLLDVLDITSTLPVERGLVVESLAYSMLLAGPDFASWRRRRPRREPPPPERDPVRITRQGGELGVELNRPERLNAFGRAVRDGLLDALDVAVADPTVTTVRLTGAGPAFCSGGDLDEFGTASDVVSAHALRLDHSAGLGVHRLRDRVRPELHGACVGAGIEVPAFAERVVARDDAWFQLPELAMGLIPGAGGTVSVCRRIGRWRMAYLALTGRRLDVATALSWGLVDGRA